MRGKAPKSACIIWRKVRSGVWIRSISRFFKKFADGDPTKIDKKSGNHPDSFFTPRFLEISRKMRSGVWIRSISRLFKKFADGDSQLGQPSQPRQHRQLRQPRQASRQAGSQAGSQSGRQAGSQPASVNPRRASRALLNIR